MKYTHKQISDMTSLYNHHHAKPDNQHKMILKTIEEFASINKLLVKLLLKEIKLHDIELLDELFDADFMMFQLKRIIVHDKYIKELFNNVINAKLERELKRWGLND